MESIIQTDPRVATGYVWCENQLKNFDTRSGSFCLAGRGEYGQIWLYDRRIQHLLEQYVSGI